MRGDDLVGGDRRRRRGSRLDQSPGLATRRIAGSSTDADAVHRYVDSYLPDYVPEPERRAAVHRVLDDRIQPALADDGVFVVKAHTGAFVCRPR